MRKFVFLHFLIIFIVIGLLCLPLSAYDVQFNFNSFSSFRVITDDNRQLRYQIDGYSSESCLPLESYSIPSGSKNITLSLFPPGRTIIEFYTDVSFDFDFASYRFNYSFNYNAIQSNINSSLNISANSFYTLLTGSVFLSDNDILLSSDDYLTYTGSLSGLVLIDSSISNFGSRYIISHPSNSLELTIPLSYFDISVNINDFLQNQAWVSDIIDSQDKIKDSIDIQVSQDSEFYDSLLNPSEDVQEQIDNIWSIERDNDAALQDLVDSLELDKPYLDISDNPMMDDNYIIDGIISSMYQNDFVLPIFGLIGTLMILSLLMFGV